MSRKNHQMVNGHLLQMDKRFSDLRQKQRETITDWLYGEYRHMCLACGREPGPRQDDEIVGNTYIQIEAAEIWIPFGEVWRHYKGRKAAFRRRLRRELEREAFQEKTEETGRS